MKRRKSNVKYFHVFGSKFYILADKEQRRKMDPKVKNVYSLITPQAAERTNYITSTIRL